jgi:hypothetical protein
MADGGMPDAGEFDAKLMLKRSAGSEERTECALGDIFSAEWCCGKSWPGEESGT